MNLYLDMRICIPVAIKSSTAFNILYKIMEVEVVSMGYQVIYKVK